MKTLRKYRVGLQDTIQALNWQIANKKGVGGVQIAEDELVLLQKLRKFLLVAMRDCMKRPLLSVEDANALLSLVKDI